MKVIVTIEFQRCIADATIFSIIICKSSYCQKFYFIILFKFDKVLEIYFHYIILIFYLYIDL